MTKDIYASVNEKLDVLAAMPERVEAVRERILDLINAGAINRPSSDDDVPPVAQGHS